MQIFITLVEAVINMLEHPFRLVNKFINHDDETDELSKMESAGSHDRVLATPPPPSTDSAGDTPTLECAAGSVCDGGGEGVKIDNSPSQDDLTSTTPLENNR